MDLSRTWKRIIDWIVAIIVDWITNNVFCNPIKINSWSSLTPLLHSRRWRIDRPFGYRPLSVPEVINRYWHSTRFTIATNRLQVSLKSLQTVELTALKVVEEILVEANWRFQMIVYVSSFTIFQTCRYNTPLKKNTIIGKSTDTALYWSLPDAVTSAQK